MKNRNGNQARAIVPSEAQALRDKLKRSRQRNRRLKAKLASGVQPYATPVTAGLPPRKTVAKVGVDQNIARNPLVRNLLEATAKEIQTLLKDSA